MTAIIYEINNTENNKRYIGSTSQWKRRKYEHRYLLEQGEHGNRHLQNAWDKHGSDAFKFSIIEETDQQFSREQDYLDSEEWSNLYNISEQAEGGNIFSELSPEEKKKFRKKSKHIGQENGMYGKSHTEDTIEKMKEKADGRYTLEWFIDRYGEEKGRQKYEKRCEWLSNRDYENPMENEEHRQKISEKLSGRSKSEEHKQKISESREGINTGKDNPNYKHVPKSKLRTHVIDSDMNFQDIADHFGTTTQTIRRKMKDYFGMTYSEMA